MALIRFPEGVMKLAVPMFVGLLCAAGMPFAAQADTVLHLSETGQAAVHPDRLVAALRIEASAVNPADAQKRVNVEMAQALTEAHAVSGLTVSTSAYSAWQPHPPGSLGAPAKSDWYAGQSLILESGDAPALLSLVGKLQAEGMVLSQLDWRVAPDIADKARGEATRKALLALRARAEAAADALGLKFDSFSSVSLDASAPRPPLMAAPMAMRLSAPPPAAEPAETTIRATVSGEAVLKEPGGAVAAPAKP